MVPEFLGYLNIYFNVPLPNILHYCQYLKYQVFQGALCRQGDQRGLQIVYYNLTITKPTQLIQKMRTGFSGVTLFQSRTVCTEVMNLDTLFH